jgi:hypothetical protein
MATPMNRDKEQKIIMRAEDILAQMRKGIQETYEIRLRGALIPVRVLTVTEMNDARREGLSAAIAIKGDETDKNLFQQKTILKLASTIVKGAGPMLSDKLLDMLSADELDFIYREYINIVDRVNPDMEQMTEEEFRHLVDMVKKNTMTSRECTLRQLRVIFTAYQDLIQRQASQTSHQAK